MTRTGVFRAPFYAGALTVGAFAATVWAASGAGGLLYAVLYFLGTIPGWPLGFCLFGRRHAAGWVAGALFGYALLALVLWAATTLGGRSAAALTLGWLIVAVATFVATRRVKAPLVTLPSWQTRDTVALLLVLVLAPAIFFFPYRNLGRSDSDGTRYYRAYFTADFLWHVALTAEIAKYTEPPRNPYLADRPLHYYWTYFVVPAAISTFGPAPVADVEAALKTNAICTGTLFLAALMVVTWCAVPHGGPAAAAVLLTLVATSAEGAYALYRDIWVRGLPLASLTILNVDALSNWYFGGLRIDGLPRSMWYTPQHSMSVALGIMALPVAGATSLYARGIGAPLLAGAALGGAVIFNPLLGGMFSIIYGVVVAGVAVRERAASLVVRHAAATIPVVAALGWTFLNEMAEGAASALHIGVAELARRRPLMTLFLSTGPALVPALAGLWRVRTLEQRVWPAAVGLAAGLVLLYFVSLTVESSYVGFRAGQIIQISLPALIAVFISRQLTTPRWRAATTVGTIALIAIGLPTTIIDTYNAQDIGNQRRGPGFRWTIATTADKQAAFRWLQRATPRTAVVQMDPIVRARETWTQIPTFAHRRMAAGLPISLLNSPEYMTRSRAVHALYRTEDPRRAWEIARKMGIDYVYMDRIERAGLPAGFEEKFALNPALFQQAYANSEVSIYAVAR